MQYKTSLLAFIWLVSNVVGQCPIGVHIKSPCGFIAWQTDCEIYCRGYESFNMKTVMTDLSSRLPADRKAFKQLGLYSTTLDELPANAFADIQFNKIYTTSNNYLKYIDVDAFNGTIATLTELHIDNSPVSESVTDRSQLFAAIRTLKALQFITLFNTSVQSLPSLSLSGLKKLHTIAIGYNPLRSIFPNAFNDLPALKSLQFYQDSPIERVAEHAFTVGHNSTDQSLEISFESQLKDPFNSRAFESIGCATTIKLGKNSMNYLDSNEFNVFLSENPKNTVFDESIDCADSRNQWIQKKYPKVWHDLKCK